MKPDFLLIPSIVHSCEDLQPSDWIVYAVVYWLEKMRDGKCTASNETIANVARIGERSVRASLERLEKQGFIRREYRDKKKKDRAQILCLVAYGLHETVVAKDTQTKALTGFEVAAPDVDTPGEYARKFFEGDWNVVAEIGKSLQDSGLPQSFVVPELVKFKSYWTEPTKNGKKQRWQLQQTFDVKRRIGTWLRNAAERSNGNRKSGAGSVV